MPNTSIPWRRNETAAVEITALAAGAGPPANRMATRRIGLFSPWGRDRMVIACVLRSLSLRGQVIRSVRGEGAAPGGCVPAMHPDSARASGQCEPALDGATRADPQNNPELREAATSLLRDAGRSRSRLPSRVQRRLRMISFGVGVG